VAFLLKKIIYIYIYIYMSTSAALQLFSQ
jgi:hypothetical protein